MQRNTKRRRTSFEGTSVLFNPRTRCKIGLAGLGIHESTSAVDEASTDDVRCTRPRTVRGRRAALQQIVEMPMDVVYEVKSSSPAFVFLALKMLFPPWRILRYVSIFGPKICSTWPERQRIFVRSL